MNIFNGEWVKRSNEKLKGEQLNSDCHKLPRIKSAEG